MPHFGQERVRSWARAKPQTCSGRRAGGATGAAALPGPRRFRKSTGTDAPWCCRDVDGGYRSSGARPPGARRGRRRALAILPWMPSQAPAAGMSAPAVPPRAVVHLVPHTHWDREWYEPFQTFRLRLVDLVDELLARMAADRRMRFTLDGQCATVDDYLEVRPEAESQIRRLVGEGRLAIGPWQILMDEFLVSGETIVRNLELGWRRATELGAAMPVGYLPDMFGHIAQMPQILRRAGIDRAVVWRGVPKAIDRNTFLWRAPDGSSVETEYLVGGYGQGAHLFDVPDRLASKLAGYVRANAPFYGEQSLLAMYGTDHAVPSPRLVDLVEAVNRTRDDIEVRLATLAEYASGAADRDDDRPRREWTGELRSGARANMLMSVTSARIDVKAAAARAERLLERYAEPLTALHGAAWPERPLELAWRRVVDNSAHDSICGCSHDAVHAQVLTRYAEAEQLARGVLKRTLDRIGRRAGAGRWVAVNPSPRAREDLVEIDVAVPRDVAAVHLRSGARIVPTQELGRQEPLVDELRLRGAEIAQWFARRLHGRELLGRQVNGASIERDGVEHPRLVVAVDAVADPPELDVEELVDGITAAAAARPDEPWDVFVVASDRRRVLVRVEAPALGWSTVELATEGQPAVVEHAVAADDHGLDNGLVRVALEPDGTFTLAGGGVTLDGVGRLVDGGDFGDSYNYGPPRSDRLVETPREVRSEILERGPLRGRLAVNRRYDLPRGVEADGSARTRDEVETWVRTEVELRAGEPFIRVALGWDNRSRDHRLRWHVPLPAAVGRSSAEGQFAVVERGLEPEGGHGEVPLPTFPAVALASVAGVTALLDQVTEYEVVDGRELALTVLRSFGLISRNDNPYREDPAGPQVPVEDGQRVGPCRFRFALLPHGGEWSAADVLPAAERYRHPFLVARGAHGEPAAADDGALYGLSIDGHGVVMARSAGAVTGSSSVSWPSTPRPVP